MAFILVTGDDVMPAEHREQIGDLGMTVATIGGRIPDDPSKIEAWKRDSVHRWAHVMANQEAATIRRYNPKGHRLWTQRRR